MPNRFTLLPLFFLLLLPGCRPAAVPTTSLPPATRSRPISTVGVIDMQRISNQMGLEEQLAAKQRELHEQYSKLDQQSRKELADKLKELGGDAGQLSDEQRKQLSEMDAERRQKLRRKEAETQQVMRETGRWLQQVLSQKTKQPIAEIAQRRGLDLVLIQGPRTFAYLKPAVDITDEVIEVAGIGSAASVPPSGPSSVDKTQTTEPEAAE
jgi:Skp family chaperone for outer membrane proteins